MTQSLEMKTKIVMIYQIEVDSNSTVEVGGDFFKYRVSDEKTPSSKTL